MDFPNKKYDIIYADPPWDYSRRLVNPNRRPETDWTVSDTYPTISMADLENLPVISIAADDCLVFLWVTSPLLDECIDVGKSWGFKFITVGFVWQKQGKPIMGHYTLSSCELCLIFKHGCIPKPRGARNIRQFLSTKRGRHSEKPLEVKHRIDKMFPSQSKIELFARPLPLFAKLDDGWDYWGNEVEVEDEVY